MHRSINPRKPGQSQAEPETLLKPEISIWVRIGASAGAIALVGALGGCGAFRAAAVDAGHEAPAARQAAKEAAEQGAGTAGRAGEDAKPKLPPVKPQTDSQPKAQPRTEPNTEPKTDPQTDPNAQKPASREKVVKSHDETESTAELTVDGNYYKLAYKIVPKAYDDGILSWPEITQISSNAVESSFSVGNNGEKGTVELHAAASSITKNADGTWLPEHPTVNTIDGVVSPYKYVQAKITAAETGQ